jgi:hypothetical protein
MCHQVIIANARTVEEAVIDVEENESWERLQIDRVQLVRYLGRSTEGLQRMREEFEAGNKGIVIPTQV